jgi:hypothetical protein
MIDVEQVRRLVRQKEDAYNVRLGQARLISQQLRVKKSEVEQLNTRAEDLSKISALLSTYADERQAEVQKHFETVVSQGLQQIFDEDLTLSIRNKMVGRRFETDFILVSHVGDKVLETSILDARGGGVAAVAGFLLQAVLVLLTPNARPVLFLDEVFSQVSENYLPSLSEFIKELTDRTNLQIVLVTHSDVFAEDADASYRFSQTNGITTASKEGG